MSDLSWKDLIALGVAFLAFTIGFSTCRYTEHRMELESKQAAKEAKP